jgi:hypothetical protein
MLGGSERLNYILLSKAALSFHPVRTHTTYPLVLLNQAIESAVSVFWRGGSAARTRVCILTHPYSLAIVVPGLWSWGAAKLQRGVKVLEDGQPSFLG